MVDMTPDKFMLSHFIDFILVGMVPRAGLHTRESYTPST